MWEALRLSLICATAATALSLVLGVPLAWLLARTEFPGRGLVRALVTLPLVLPPVVGGVALLLALGQRRHRRAVAGRVVRHHAAVHHHGRGPRGDVRRDAVPGHQRGGHAARRRPALRGGRHHPRRLPLHRLPPGHPAADRTGIAAGAVLAWARALGEFGATITFAGNFPGRTQTMPLAVYLALQNDPAAAIALSLVLLTVSIAVLAGLRDRWMRAT
ncbi:Molybdenum transport system permease OS=Streptomyces griseomycini OX=66895 GN=FHS37_004087 PE=3 SV=1 [Streptomyces griseomycini]